MMSCREQDQIISFLFLGQSFFAAQHLRRKKMFFIKVGKGVGAAQRCWASSHFLSKWPRLIFLCRPPPPFSPTLRRRDAAYDYVKYWITVKGWSTEPGATHY